MLKVIKHNLPKQRAKERLRGLRFLLGFSHESHSLFFFPGVIHEYCLQFNFSSRPWNPATSTHLCGNFQHVRLLPHFKIKVELSLAKNKNIKTRNNNYYKIILKICICIKTAYIFYIYLYFIYSFYFYPKYLLLF